MRLERARLAETEDAKPEDIRPRPPGRDPPPPPSTTARPLAARLYPRTRVGRREAAASAAHRRLITGICPTAERVFWTRRPEAFT